MSLDILAFKMDKHKQKLNEMFTHHGSQQSINKIRIDQFKQIFRDLAYLGGIVFCTQKEFNTTQDYAGFRDSSKSFLK